MYRELYEEHAPLMRFLSSHGIPQPRGFAWPPSARSARASGGSSRSAARASRVCASVLEEARKSGIALHEDGLGLAFEQTVERLAEDLAAKPEDLARLEALEGVVDLAKSLPFEVDFWKVQNVYYGLARTVLPARRREADSGFGHPALGRAVPRARREALGAGARRRARPGPSQTAATARAGLLH